MQATDSAHRLNRTPLWIFLPEATAASLTSSALRWVQQFCKKHPSAGLCSGLVDVVSAAPNGGRNIRTCRFLRQRDLPGIKLRPKEVSKGAGNLRTPLRLQP